MKEVRKCHQRKQRNHYYAKQWVKSIDVSFARADRKRILVTTNGYGTKTQAIMTSRKVILSASSHIFR